MNASKHDENDAPEVAASEEAAPASGAAAPAPRAQAPLQVASDGGPVPEAEPACPEPESNHQHAVELELEALVARADKADQYLDLAQRTKADFENYRKRTARDAAAAQTRGVSKLALELLPAIDNLERALFAANDTAAEELMSGIRLVHDEILAALGRAGIEPYSPQGEPFDPQQHEAVAQLPAPEAEPGTIVEVYQRGYRLGDSVLRPARVSVAG